MITIRAFTEADIQKLFEWRNSESYLRLCSVRRYTVSFEKFKTEIETDFKRDRHTQSIISKDEKPIGTIFSYNFNKIDGHAFFTAYIEPDFEKKGYGAIAVVIFLIKFFEAFPVLYKVYVEVYDYNNISLKSLVNGGFKTEGVFKEHRLVDGKRYDLIRLAFYRSDLDTAYKLVSKFQKHKKLVLN